MPPRFKIAITNWQASQALREQVKELTCLYRMARIDARGTRSLEDLMGQIAAIVSAAWLHSDDARVRICLDDAIYGDPDFCTDRPTMGSGIMVEGQRRGQIEVTYATAQLPMDDGPFLKEEHKLLDAIALELAQIIAQKDFQREKAQMRERLAHTDRLNMMGQLSVSIAHEINEPLNALLGYAQLAAKCPGVPGPGGHRPDHFHLPARP